MSTASRRAAGGVHHVPKWGPRMRLLPSTCTRLPHLRRCRPRVTSAASPVRSPRRRLTSPGGLPPWPSGVTFTSRSSQAPCVRSIRSGGCFRSLLVDLERASRAVRASCGWRHASSLLSAKLPRVFLDECFKETILVAAWSRTTSCPWFRKCDLPRPGPQQVAPKGGASPRFGRGGAASSVSVARSSVMRGKSRGLFLHLNFFLFIKILSEKNDSWVKLSDLFNFILFYQRFPIINEKKWTLH